MKIKITSGENYAVLGLDGAMLNSLNKNNTEYLWQGDAKYWAGQAPVCFPITGVLPNGEMEAFGKRCTMKRHGVARINPFEVLEQHKNSVTFVQRSDENTKRDFPFDYELKIKYTINGDTVTNEYIVTNTGETWRECRAVPAARRGCGGRQQNAEPPLAQRLRLSDSRRGAHQRRRCAVYADLPGV